MWYLPCAAPRSENLNGNQPLLLAPPATQAITGLQSSKLNRPAGGTERGKRWQRFQPAEHPTVIWWGFDSNAGETFDQVSRLVNGRAFALESPSQHLVRCRQ